MGAPDHIQYGKYSFLLTGPIGPRNLFNTVTNQSMLDEAQLKPMPYDL